MDLETRIEVLEAVVKNHEQALAYVGVSMMVAGGLLMLYGVKELRRIVKELKKKA